MYILNRVPSKSVAKTPYKLWIGNKLSIRHLHVLGCPAQARLIGQMKRNWTKKQLAPTLLVMPNALRALTFIIPLLYHFLRWEMQDSFRMLSFKGKITYGVLFLKKSKRTIGIKFSNLIFFVLILLCSSYFT